MPPPPFDELARRWVPGEGPVEIEPLASGLVNDTCRVTRALRRFSLRVARPHGLPLGADRGWECRVLAQAAAAGLAPELHCCEPRAGILVSGWADGGHWSAEEALHAANIPRVARLLRRIHALEIPALPRVVSPEGWIARYSAALERRRRFTARCAELGVAARRCSAQLPAVPGGGVLCHGDLHRLNLAIGDTPVPLDWEYAHVSDPLWDVAGWVCNADASADYAAELLDCYLGRGASRTESERLMGLLRLFDYVCLLWSELYLCLAPAAGSSVIAARAVTLERRL